MNNILITGSKGQLGSEIEALHGNYAYNFFFTDKDELDISDKQVVENFCKKQHISHIINCAAYTAVDKAEDERELADKINHQAVENLSKTAKTYEITLVHISTDYVFDGTNYKPYIEDDKVNPIGIYGKTKLDGEKILQKINPKNSIIIRTSWLYSSYGYNFVKTMLRLGHNKESLNVVFDQVGTPTYAKDLAHTILEILLEIKNQKTQLFHYSNEGVCSWYDFASEIMEQAKLPCKVLPITSDKYPTPTRRPHYSVLSKDRIKNTFNIEIPHWRESLKECLNEIGEKNR